MRDDELRLIFTCCHPALSTSAQVALTLRLLGGLTTPEIARAFLVPEATMAQRLARAKGKIRAATHPLPRAGRGRASDRLRAALAVVYLIFNEGHMASEGESLVRAELCREAIRLGRLLADLMPDEPEVLGLLALMLLVESRRAARAGAELVLLADQDRTLWDRELIAEGQAIVRRCLRRGQPGPYQVQAAIQAVHSDAPTAAATDWRADRAAVRPAAGARSEPDRGVEPRGRGRRGRGPRGGARARRRARARGPPSLPRGASGPAAAAGPARARPPPPTSGRSPEPPTTSSARSSSAGWSRRYGEPLNGHARREPPPDRPLRRAGRARGGARGRGRGAALAGVRSRRVGRRQDAAAGRLERRAAGTAMLVLAGDCVDLGGEGELPYLPLVAALRPLARPATWAHRAYKPSRRCSPAGAPPARAARRACSRACCRCSTRSGRSGRCCW